MEHITILCLPDHSGWETNYFSIKYKNTTFLLEYLNARDLFYSLQLAKDDTLPFLIKEKGSVRAAGFIYYSEYFGRPIWQPEYDETKKLNYITSELSYFRGSHFDKKKQYHIEAEGLDPGMIIERMITQEASKQKFETMINNSILNFKRQVELLSSARVSIAPFHKRPSRFQKYLPGVVKVIDY